MSVKVKLQILNIRRFNKTFAENRDLPGPGPKKTPKHFDILRMVEINNSIFYPTENIDQMKKGRIPAPEPN